MVGEDVTGMERCSRSPPVANADLAESFIPFDQVYTRSRSTLGPTLLAGATSPYFVMLLSRCRRSSLTSRTTFEALRRHTYSLPRCRCATYHAIYSLGYCGKSSLVWYPGQTHIIVMRLLPLALVFCRSALVAHSPCRRPGCRSYG